MQKNESTHKCSFNLVLRKGSVRTNSILHDYTFRLFYSCSASGITFMFTSDIYCV